MGPDSAMPGFTHLQVQQMDSAAARIQATEYRIIPDEVSYYENLLQLAVIMWTQRIGSTMRRWENPKQTKALILKLIYRDTPIR